MTTYETRPSEAPTRAPANGMGTAAKKCSQQTTAQARQACVNQNLGTTNP